jgi:hypothetical protein
VTKRRRAERSEKASKKKRPARRRRKPGAGKSSRSALAAKDAADVEFAKRARRGQIARDRADKSRVTKLLMKRGMSKKDAVTRWKLGLRPQRRKAIFSPADVSRDKLVEKFRFHVRKDGSVDTKRVYYRKGPKRGRKASPAAVRRSRAAFLREARYRQIADALDVPVAEAKRLVRDKYQGETRNALVQTVYQALVGKDERKSGPVHWSEDDRLEDEDE